MGIKGILSNMLGKNKNAKANDSVDAPIPFPSSSNAASNNSTTAKPEIAAPSSVTQASTTSAKFNPPELNQFPKYKEIQQHIQNLIGLITPASDLDLIALQAERRRAINDITDQWIDIGFPPLDQTTVVYQQIMPPIKVGKDETKVRYGEFVHLHHDVDTSTRESDQIKSLINWILILKNFADKNPSAYMNLVQEMYAGNDPDNKKLAQVMALIVESPLVNQMIEYPGRVREQPFRDLLENAFRQLHQVTAKLS